jgi:hypothetical protein
MNNWICLIIFILELGIFPCSKFLASEMVFNHLVNGNGLTNYWVQFNFCCFSLSRILSVLKSCQSLFESTPGFGLDCWIFLRAVLKIYSLRTFQRAFVNPFRLDLPIFYLNSNLKLRSIIYMSITHNLALANLT